LSLAVLPHRRWADVGCSDASDAWTAAVSATAAARDGRRAGLLIVFSAGGADPDAVAAGVNEAGDGARVVGCTVPAYLGSQGVGEAGVLVLALGGEDFQTHTAAAAAAPDARAAGTEVAQRLRQAAHPGLAGPALLLSGARAGDQCEIVRGAYGVMGATVPLIGGFTAAPAAGWPTHQYHAECVATDAVVGASLGVRGRFGIGLAHGVERTGEPVVVTHSEGNRIVELDGRPALDVYLDAVQAPAVARLDPEAFAAFAVAHPFGLCRSSGLVQARCVVRASFRERTLECLAAIPPGSLVWPGTATVNSTLDAATLAATEAVDALGRHRPRALLVFDSTGRRQLLGPDSAREELHLITDVADGAAVAGFCTDGEIARARGAGGFHNHAIAILALG
jgi:hypothetical protein